MASTYLDLSAADQFLKNIYPDGRPKVGVYQDRPFLAMLKKKEDFYGDFYKVPFRWADGGGGSSQFSNAQANQSAPQTAAFYLVRKKDYAIKSVDNETDAASSTTMGAFISAAEVVIDAAQNQAAEALSIFAWGDGTGTRGVIGTITSGVIVLTNEDDITKFDYGMKLNASGDGSTLRAGTGWVVGRDEFAGTITVSLTNGGAAATPSAWAPGDLIVRDGDLNNVMSGVQAWIPSSVTSTDSFFTQNRFPDTRLRGLYGDLSAKDIQEAMVLGMKYVVRAGGHPDVIFCSYTTYAALENALGSQKRYVEVKGEGGISFTGIELNTRHGSVKVIPDRHHPAKQITILTMDSWALYSLGPAPKILTYRDGNKFLRVGNADAAELRIGSYAQVGSDYPGANGRFLVAE
jgi:hypothetical protein